MMRRGILFVASMILIGGMDTAQAETILDFNLDASHPVGASIGYAGGAAPLIASNLSVDSVIGLSTPLNDGSMLSLNGGLLNFQTGNLTGSDASHWYFGAGGTISITTTSPIVAGASNTLLTGTFKSAEVAWNGGEFKVVIASYFNGVDDSLAGYYGVAPGRSWEGDLNLSFRASSGSPPAAFRSSQVLSGDVTTAVPEPSSLVMAGLGTLGLAMFRLRRCQS